MTWRKREIMDMARESHVDVYGLAKDHEKFVAALETFAKLVREDALAQPEQEPVAWITPHGEGFRIRFSPPTSEVPLGWDALYTTQPQRTEQNFCPRCGKRTPDAITIHTCTPPQENT